MPPIPLLVGANAAIMAHGTNHELNTDFQCASSPKGTLQGLSPFLWSAAHNKIHAQDFLLCADDQELLLWCQQRHNSCISATDLIFAVVQTLLNDATAKQLVMNIKVQPDVLDFFCSEHDASSLEKKDTFKNLYDYVRTMILNTPSSNR